MYIINDSKTRKLSLLQQTLHNICFITFILASICDMLHGLGALISNTNILSHRILSVIIAHVFADVFYYTSSLTLYILLIHRLFSTFTNTAYAISKWFYYWISVQIIIQIILMLIYIIMLILYDCRSTIGCRVMGICASVIMINDYILNIVCITLFVKKLRQLMVAKLKGEVSEWMSPDKSVKSCVKEMIKENTLNNNLLTVITKQTVIGIFVTLTNQAFATCIFIVFTFDSAQEAGSLVMVAYLLRGGESAFICVLLYLGLQINEKEYNRLCKCCHRACKNFCRFLTAKSVKRRVRYSAAAKRNNDYVAMEDVERE